MSWTKVLSVDSLAPGARQVVKVGENSILLINNNGQFHAVGNRCPHLKLSMTKGKITEDGAIVCPWHRSSFDLCSGAVKDWKSDGGSFSTPSFTRLSPSHRRRQHLDRRLTSSPRGVFGQPKEQFTRQWGNLGECQTLPRSLP